MKLFSKASVSETASILRFLQSFSRMVGIADHGLDSIVERNGYTGILTTRLCARAWC